MLLGESLKAAFVGMPHAIDKVLQPEADLSVGFSLNGHVFTSHILNGEMNIAKTVGVRTICLKQDTEELFNVIFMDGDAVALEKMSYDDLDRHGEALLGAALARLVYKASETVVTDVMGLKIA